MSNLKKNLISFLGIACLYLLLYVILFECSQRYLFSFKETLVFFNSKFIYQAYYLSWEKLYFIFGIFMLLFVIFFCTIQFFIKQDEEKRVKKEILNFIDGVVNEEY